MSKDIEIIVEVVVNTCYGGFSLSSKAAEMVLQRKGIDYRLEDSIGRGTNDDRSYPFIGTGWDSAIDICARNDADLIAVVRELGPEASGGPCTKLEIVQCRVGIEIEGYDGKETVRASGGVY